MSKKLQNCDLCRNIFIEEHFTYVGKTLKNDRIYRADDTDYCIEQITLKGGPFRSIPKRISVTVRLEDDEFAIFSQERERLRRKLDL